MDKCEGRGKNTGTGKDKGKGGGKNRHEGKGEETRHTFHRLEPRRAVITLLMELYRSVSWRSNANAFSGST